MSTAERDAQVARDVHALVKDLLTPDARIYWVDFMVTWSVGVLALWVYLTSPLLSWEQTVSFLVAAFAIYRLLVFTHELAHQHGKAFRSFRIVWNALFGVPCLMPSFLYTDHKSHHVNHSYATHGDAEYHPLGRGPAWLLAGYFAQVLVLPVAAVIRFVVLGPLSLLHPALRKVVWERFSSLATINPHYRRSGPLPRERVGIALAEFGAFAWAAAILALVLAGALSWTLLPKLYVLFVFVTAVNYTRALGAHRYIGGGEPMTYVEQLLDSTTIPGGLLTELWAPLGMRYHALHHLVPSLPYHAMGKAHRRLMDELPADSPYRATLRPSLWSAIADVYHGARGGRALEPV